MFNFEGGNQAQPEQNSMGLDAVTSEMAIGIKDALEGIGDASKEASWIAGNALKGFLNLG